MGWNPLSWPAAITSTAYTGAGYITRPFSKDYGDYFLTAGAVGRGEDYAPSEFSKGGTNISEIKASAAETDRYTKRVVEEIAPNTELALASAAEVVEIAASMGTSTLVKGGTKGLSKLGIETSEKLLAKKAPMLLRGISFLAGGSTGITSRILESQGEAPLYGPFDVIPGVKDYLGNEHYAAGGTPYNYPTASAKTDDLASLESLINQAQEQLPQQQTQQQAQSQEQQRLAEQVTSHYQELQSQKNQLLQQQEIPPASGGFFAWLGNLLSSIVNGIKSLFTKKQDDAPPVLAAAAPVVPVAQNTNTPAESQPSTLSHGLETKTEIKTPAQVGK